MVKLIKSACINDCNYVFLLQLYFSKIAMQVGFLLWIMDNLLFSYQYTDSYFLVNINSFVIYSQKSHRTFMYKLASTYPSSSAVSM